MAVATVCQSDLLCGEELKARLDSGEEVTILDARSHTAWPGCPLGNADPFTIHHALGKDLLTVAYCT